MALLEEDAVRMATVRATEETTCLRLDRTTFHVLLGGAAAEVLRWEQRKRNNENLKKRRPTIRLQDLSLKRTLGRGMMGRVYLALDLADDTHAKIYALKSMKKAHVVATGQAGRRATHDAQDAFGALNAFSAFSAPPTALHCACAAGGAHPLRAAHPQAPRPPVRLEARGDLPGRGAPLPAHGNAT